MKDFNLDMYVLEQLVNYMIIVRHEKMYIRCEVEFKELPLRKYIYEIDFNYEQTNEDVIIELYEMAWNTLREEYYMKKDEEHLWN